MIGKLYNQAIFLTALCVCLGFVVAGGASTVLAQTAADPGVYNKRPLENFRDKLVEWREKSNNDIYQPFEYSFEATLDKDGKLIIDPANPPKFTGRPETSEMIKTAFAALSDSGMLKLLRVFQNQKIKFVVSQDGTRFQFNVGAQQPSEAKAKSLYSALSLVVEMGRHQSDKDGDKEALELLNTTQVEASGNSVLIKSQLSNELAETLYQKYKNKAGEKK